MQRGRYGVGDRCRHYFSLAGTTFAAGGRNRQGSGEGLKSYPNDGPCLFWPGTVAILGNAVDDAHAFTCSFLFIFLLCRRFSIAFSFLAAVFFGSARWVVFVIAKGRVRAFVASPVEGAKP